MKKVKVNISELTDLIIKNGDTITSFAKKIGLTKQGLWQILNSKNNPSPITTQKICDKLSVKFDDIFTITEE